MINVMTAALLASASAAGDSLSVAAGRAAYELNKVAEAEAIYAAIIADPVASAGEKARANVELARISWLIDRDARRALDRIAAAHLDRGSACDAGIMEARILREAGRLDAVTMRGSSLLKPCDDPEKRNEIRLQLAAAQLDRAAGKAVGRAPAVVAAERELARLTAGGATLPEAAALRLEIALLKRNARAARQAWREFYWLDDDVEGPSALVAMKPFKRIDDGLAKVASDTDRVELAYLLMRAGFGDTAARFAQAEKLPGDATNPHWLMLKAYWKQRDKLTTEVAAINRALARGGPKDPRPLGGLAQQGLGALMAATGKFDNPKAVLAEYYGLVGTAGMTGGYPSAHVGHLVEERSETVTQYGHQATVRFAVIDNMWVNGFESWLWDGSAQAGGWSGDGTIVQVRSAYTSSPLKALNLVGDTPARRNLLRKLAVDEADDARNGAVPLRRTLSGLGTRLRLQLIDQIAAAARAKGGDFRRAFLNEYWRANLQQSIFVHEGRHAIDKAIAAKDAKLDDEELEYTAKLSELALSDYPRMALWNLDRGIGGGGPHDRAGTRILNAFAAWIAVNPDAIEKYDRALPASVQIDKLTDDQIRAIAKSLDPLARGAPTA